MTPEADSLVWFVHGLLPLLFVLAGVLLLPFGSYGSKDRTYKFGDCNSYTEEHDTTPLLQELLIIIFLKKKKDIILKFKHADQRVE